MRRWRFGAVNAGLENPPGLTIVTRSRACRSITFLITMANTKSAAKRARQTVKRSLRNRSVVTHLRTMQKTLRSVQTPGPEQVRALISAIDKAAKRGIIHENAANRRKARLNRALAGVK